MTPQMHNWGVPRKDGPTLAADIFEAVASVTEAARVPCTLLGCIVLQSCRRGGRYTGVGPNCHRCRRCRWARPCHQRFVLVVYPSYLCSCGGGSISCLCLP